MDEIELKFAVPADRVAGLARALRTGSVRVDRLQALYFDTDDERLARHGMAVRLRKAGRRWEQTVKAATADPLRRIEHNVPVPAPGDGIAPRLDLSRHDGTPAGDALRKLLDQEPANGGLTARFRTDVRRTTRALRFRGARLELALDIGDVTAGERSQPIREFELELKSGSTAVLVAAATTWAERHGLWISTVSKAERGARLARGDAKAEPVHAETPRLDRHPPPATFFRATIRSALTQVLGNASEVAAEDADERFVHQLRVGLRRLRTALRELASLGTGIDPAWEPVLRSAFHELGAHRDVAVVIPGLRAQLAASNAPPIAAIPKAAGARRSPSSIVRDPALQRTLLSLLALGHEPSPVVVGAPGDGADTHAFVAARLDSLLRQVTRDGRRFADLEVPRQHRVRKRLKRLRYLSEFAAPLFGRRRVERYLKRWSAAQDALGVYNDQRIAADAFRHEATERDPAAWFAVGWVAGREPECVADCSRALRKAAKARPFWAA